MNAHRGIGLSISSVKLGPYQPNNTIAGMCMIRVPIKVIRFGASHSGKYYTDFAAAGL